MSNFTFRPAQRQGAGLLLGFAGPSGSGKTYSALRVAKGLAGDKRFAFLDTEAGRATHYVGEFDFDHGDLKPPFTSERYLEAMRAADAAGYPVLVIDSFSHEHTGEGGHLDTFDAELKTLVERAAKRSGERRAEWELRDAYNQLAWQRPKAMRKRMIQGMLQLRMHLILCFRAEDKIEFAKDDKGKTVVRPKETLAGFKGWLPICGKELPYELTASFLLLPDKPGVPRPIKLQEQHRKLIPLDKPLDETVGARLAEWARGGTKPAAAEAPKAAPAPKPAKSGAIRFTIQNRQYATQGMTKEQMLESFRLAEEVTRFVDEEEPKRILSTMFPGKTSRVQLTEEEAADYLDELRRNCGEPASDENVPEAG